MSIIISQTVNMHRWCYQNCICLSFSDPRTDSSSDDAEVATIDDSLFVLRVTTIYSQCRICIVLCRYVPIRDALRYFKLMQQITFSTGANNHGSCGSLIPGALDGWFYSGDLAKLDRNGELYKIDRLKDMINVNGVKVSPAELEAILANRKHPGVDCAGVVGKKVSSNVEHPVAFVVKTPGSNVTEEELCNFLKAQVYQIMAYSEKDYIVHGPPLEYVVKYISAGKYIYDRLAKDSAFIGQIEAHTGHKYSFAEILDRSIRLALWFRDMDIRPGDVVSYVTLNHRDVIIVLYATLFVGAVLSPWDALLSPEEIACLMGRTEPKIVICSKEAAVAVQAAVKESHVTPVLVVHGELPGFIPFEDTQIQSQTVIRNFHCTEVEENDLALLVCTSGTSGLPKIVQRTHKYILMVTQRMEKRSFEGNVFITFLPLCWSPGLNGALMGPSAKLQRVVAPYFDNKLAWKWIEEYKVNFVMLSTPMYLHMINSDAISNHDVSSLKAVAVSGSELSESHYKIFEERAPVGCKLIDCYGNTETFGMITRKTRASNPLSRGKFLPGISGKIVDPITGKTISPYEPGEICLKHVIRFAGYHNDPASTKSVVDSDGWFHTGDLARFDKNGDLYIIDRLKEVINVNGFEVLPTELEAILGNHSGVDCVAVVGKRISPNLEHPVAFVVKTPGSNVTEEELRNFLKAQVKSDAKELQVGVRFIHKMPILSSGKIRRCVLRKILELETS